MPRPPISSFWKAKVATLTEEGEKPNAIFLKLQVQGEELGMDDYPSQRAVRRIVSAHSGRPPAERRPYALFRWPGAMERGDLPWEASRLTLGLLRFMEDKGLERPTLRLTRWFWRVWLAAVDPGSNEVGGEGEIFESLLWIAATLAQLEILQPFTDTPVDRTNLEHMLAYQAWRLGPDSDAYKVAIKRLGYNDVFGGAGWLVPIIEHASSDVLQTLFEEWAILFAWRGSSREFYRDLNEQLAARVKEDSTSDESLGMLP